MQILRTAKPTPALTAARARRESWPRASTHSMAAIARSPLGRSGRGLRNHRRSSGFSGSSGLSVMPSNDNEEDRHLLELRPRRAGLAPQGAQLLLGQVPRAACGITAPGRTGTPDVRNSRTSGSVAHSKSVHCCQSICSWLAKSTSKYDPPPTETPTSMRNKASRCEAS